MKFGADDEEGEADEEDAEVDELGLDVLFMQYEYAVEERYQDAASPDHRYYGYH